MKHSEPITFRLARPHEGPRVLDFINAHFDWKLPLVNLPEYFDYYYKFGEQLQFALAESGDELLCAAGYILSNRSEHPDIWVSVWVAAKGHNGVGLELMNALPGLTGAFSVSCNNIRPETRPFYHFLGWETYRVPHFYRLNPDMSPVLAQVENPVSLPVEEDLALDRVNSVTRLNALGLPEDSHLPHKDLWYLSRRYFDFPHRSYLLFSASENGKLLGYLAAHVVEACWPEGNRPPVKVLRIVDFIGEDSVLARLGGAIDRLLREYNAEYADFYCCGIPASVLAKAGFRERTEDSKDIIPNYLTPILQENIEYYCFTNHPEGFRLFKADGDQDRPNLSVV